DLSTDNLFLMVSIPTFLVAWKTKNYFVTIAVGIGLVILARWAAWAV
ncbi:MAG: AzlD domain-containing protein, partial [Desulfovibrio sp.]|nr:AzlD domain-containing protein [Desulfovibrio sp.]